MKKKNTRCSYCTPGSSTQKWAKKEEAAVEAVLRTAGFVFQREVTIDYSCFAATDNKRRAYLDFVLEMPSKRVILEVDERQHKDTTYSVACDLSRMTNVMAAVACSDNVRPTLWIRFNPNAFKEDNKTVRCPRKQRYTRLVDICHHHMPEQSTEIVYLYYDTQDGRPTLFSDGDYNDTMKQMVVYPRYRSSHK